MTSPRGNNKFLNKDLPNSITSSQIERPRNHISVRRNSNGLNNALVHLSTDGGSRQEKSRIDYEKKTKEAKEIKLFPDVSSEGPKRGT